MLTQEERKNVRAKIPDAGDRLALILEALGDLGRLRIFRLLMERHDLCVTDVAAVFGSTVPAASQQLRVLERVGLVRRERMGQMICYELRDDDPCVRSIASLVANYYER